MTTDVNGAVCFFTTRTAQPYAHLPGHHMVSLGFTLMFSLNKSLFVFNDIICKIKTIMTYFRHHWSENYVDLSDKDVDLSDKDVDQSDVLSTCHIICCYLYDTECACTRFLRFIL